MPERYYTQVADPFEDSEKQSNLEFIRKNLEDLFNYGDSSDFQTEDLENITTRDVKDYIYDELIENGIIDIQFANTVDIEEDKQVFELCEHLSLSLMRSPMSGEIQIHFLESNDFATTVFVVQTGIKNVSVKVEPLEESPEFVISEWRRIVDEKTNSRKSRYQRFQDLKNKFGKRI